MRKRRLEDLLAIVDENKVCVLPVKRCGLNFRWLKRAELFLMRFEILDSILLCHREQAPVCFLVPQRLPALHEPPRTYPNQRHALGIARALCLAHKSRQPRIQTLYKLDILVFKVRYFRTSTGGAAYQCDDPRIGFFCDEHEVIEQFDSVLTIHVEVKRAAQH
jgi:hypothetical protein